MEKDGLRVSVASQTLLTQAKDRVCLRNRERWTRNRGVFGFLRQTVTHWTDQNSSFQITYIFQFTTGKGHELLLTAKMELYTSYRAYALLFCSAHGVKTCIETCMMLVFIQPNIQKSPTQDFIQTSIQPVSFWTPSALPWHWDDTNIVTLHHPTSNYCHSNCSYTQRKKRRSLMLNEKIN